MNMHITLLSSLLLTACGPELSRDMDLSEDLREDTTARTIWDGTPDGVATLVFLNSEACTFEVLDDEVPLDRRAAGNIIAHRDGGDRTLGTTDDDIYGGFTELDRVRYVGAVSIQRIVDHVADLGMGLAGADVLGTYDGVTFTVDEAASTLKLVNSIDMVILDDDLAMNSIAVGSIQDALPIETIDGLSRLYYVGKSALNTLKAAANGE
jgi:hypothetical protein